MQLPIIIPARVGKRPVKGVVILWGGVGWGQGLAAAGPGGTATRRSGVRDIGEKRSTKTQQGVGPKGLIGG